jgi:hypothetical protein
MDWDKIDDYLKNEVFRKLDMVATRKRIERLARLYINYKSKMMILGEQKVTASYHLNGSTSNKIYNSNIEKVAMFNLDNEYQEFVSLFEGGMKSLEELEYKIFYDFYIKGKSGIACYVDLGITESEFYRVKNKSIEKVALFLGCAVFMEK